MSFIMRDEKLVLDALIATTPNFEKYNEWKFYDQCTIGHLSVDTVAHIIRDLEAKGMVFALDISSENIVNRVSLTYPGMYYKKFQWLARRDFLMRSILIPIAVSLLTTALTALVAWLWTH